MMGPIRSSTLSTVSVAAARQMSMLAWGAACSTAGGAVPSLPPLADRGFDLVFYAAARLGRLAARPGGQLVQLAQHGRALGHQLRALRAIVLLGHHAGGVVELQVAQGGQQPLALGGQPFRCARLGVARVRRPQQGPHDHVSHHREQGQV